MDAKQVRQKIGPPIAGPNVRCPAHDDRTPSLTVHDKNGQVLLNCKAGCSQENVLEALERQHGITRADLFHVEHSGNGGRPRVEVCRYDYHDAEGGLRYHVVRYSDKSFRPVHVVNGSEVWRFDGIERLCYRLPGLVGKRHVLWVEGEKDVDTLVALGIAATTSPGGAMAFSKGSYVEQLVALGVTHVTIIPDNDAPGFAYAAEVLNACIAKGLTAKIVSLPAGKDVTDYFAQGHTLD